MPRYELSVVIPATSVRMIREHLELSQRAFADRLGVCHRTVVRWEQAGAVLEVNNIRNSTLWRLTKLATKGGLDLVDDNH